MSAHSLQPLRPRQPSCHRDCPGKAQPVCYLQLFSHRNRQNDNYYCNRCRLISRGFSIAGRTRMFHCPECGAKTVCVQGTQIHGHCTNRVHIPAAQGDCGGWCWWCCLWTSRHYLRTWSAAQLVTSCPHGNRLRHWKHGASSSSRDSAQGAQDDNARSW